MHLVNGRGRRLPMSVCIISVLVATVALAAVACGSSDQASPVPASSVPPTESPKISVVTSTSILADWVRQVGGDRVDVTELVPRQVDPHSFQPGAQDIAAVSDADVVFVIGLDLEADWLDDLISNAASDADSIVSVSTGVNTLPFSGDDHADEEADGHDEDQDGDDHADEEAEGHDEDQDGDDHADEEADGHDEDQDGDDHADEEADGHDEDQDGDDHADEEADGHDEDQDGDDHADEEADGHDEDQDGDDHADEDEEDGHGDEGGHGHGSTDPHFWMNPIEVKSAISAIADALAARDAASGDAYRSAAADYSAQLDELDAWVMTRVAAVPQAQRLLLTSHDALGYYADRYGFKVVGAVIPGGGTEVEPSPQVLASLVHEIEETGARVIFSEAELSDDLARTLASESGATVVGGLHTGSLGADGSNAAQYIGMIRHNTDVIVDALTSQ